MAKRKSWQEKLNINRKPEVVGIQKSYAGIPAGAQVLVSTPREVAAFVRRIPAGRFVAPEQVRRRLAAKHNANAACPLATGIFLRIVAEAAWEQIQQGQDASEVTPFWRVIPPRSPLAKKLTCGEAFVRKMQRQESIEV